MHTVGSSAEAIHVLSGVAAAGHSSPGFTIVGRHEPALTVPTNSDQPVGAVLIDPCPLSVAVQNGIHLGHSDIPGDFGCFTATVDWCGGRRRCRNQLGCGDRQAGDGRQTQPDKGGEGSDGADGLVDCLVDQWLEGAGGEVYGLMICDDLASSAPESFGA